MGDILWADVLWAIGLLVTIGLLFGRAGTFEKIPSKKEEWNGWRD